MVHETTERDPERIYLEPWPYSPEGRLWSEEDVWPLYTWPPEPEDESPRALGVEYIRADLHAAEIARLRAIIEADGLDPDAPMPPGLTVVNERLRRKLKEAWRERSAARAEALTAQASLRRVERELEEARERERALREALEPFAYLDYDIGDEWRDDCERARRALAKDTEVSDGE